MAIRRIKLDRMTTTNTYMGIGSLRFYDKNMVLYPSGNLIKSGSDRYKGESENFYAEVSAPQYDPSYNPIEALYTGTSYTDVTTYRYISNTAKYDSTWFNVIFKKPVETIGMIQLDIAPYTNTSTNSPINIHVYDENDELIITYNVNPFNYFLERNMFRFINILTPELTEKQKYMVLSDIQTSGIKNYVIKEREVNVVPWYGEEQFDEVVKSFEASLPYTYANIPFSDFNVYNQRPIKDYEYYAYYQSQFAPNGLTNVVHDIEFHKPQLLNALEINIPSDDYSRNLRLAVEALDQITNVWILLKYHESEREPQYDVLRLDFENSNYYFKYRLRVINVYNGTTLWRTNGLRWIEKQHFIQEVSIATADDYKKRGMKLFKQIGTNNIRKSVTIPSKTKFGNGNTFSKKFDLTTENIRSITI